ncbi:MAG: stage 0 sporulation family protein [Tissierellia bacterium]|nr:stage 0 sporulation family protein [Tissierellia bacterium]
MINVVGVRFKKAGKIYYFDPADMDINLGDNVIVETIRGVEYGKVVVGKKKVSECKIVKNLKPVIRIATTEDEIKYQDNVRRAEEALVLCEEKIKAHGLKMKLINAEYTFDNNKILFYFTADGRIDFRELVKDLAAIFKTRIELRQIGVRDEAKHLGALGCCGRETCCSSYLCEFNPVSIKMAKDQSLSLNPTKISGICGRLMCCLRYEQEGYEEMLKKMPKLGAIVKTEDGKGTVISNNPMQNQVRVKIESDGDILLSNYNIDEIYDTGKIDNDYKNKSESNRDKDVGEDLKELEND